MNELKQYIKDLLIELNIIKAERQPELEKNYLEAYKKFKRINKVASLPTFNPKKRQPVMVKAVSEMWKAKDRLTAAGYKQRDIAALRESI